MTLKTWIDANCDIINKPMLATQVARRFLRETDQAVDQTTLNKTIVELHNLGLLVGKPNKPGTYSRLVAK